ncbi:hypothetical protein KJ633_07345, partial [bacterium]|nr:hypothetical protein [bacterium]
VPGNQIDFYWHQKSLNPPAPEEHYSRLITATDDIYKDGLAKGLFINDLSRAFWGSKGPYSAKEWLAAGASAFSYLRKHSGLSQIAQNLKLPEKVYFGEVFYCSVFVENISGRNLKNLEISLLLPGKGIVCLEEAKKKIEFLSAGEKKEIIFKLQGAELDEKRDSRWMIASRIVGLEYPDFVFSYVKVFKAFMGGMNNERLRTGKIGSSTEGL